MLDRPAPDRRRVLLVEDNDSVRRAVSLALTAAGFDVTAVTGGVQALAVFDAVRPAVLVTDLSMPGMDGFELVRTLRVRQVGVPVLVISARDSAPDRAAALAAGCDSYLVKPFGLAELRERVSALSDARCDSLMA
jgi:two-component system, OmpR family, response regulator MprA